MKKVELENLHKEIETLRAEINEIASNLAPNLSVKVSPRSVWHDDELYVEVTDPKVFWSSYMTAYIKENGLSVNHSSGGYNEGVSGLEILDAEIAINEAVKTLWENREKMLKIVGTINEKESKARTLREEVREEERESIIEENLKELTNSGFKELSVNETLEYIEKYGKVYAVTDKRDKRYETLNAYKKYTGRFYLYGSAVSKKELKEYLSNMNIIVPA